MAIILKVMWNDVFGCLRVVVMFALLLLAPGYLLGWATDLVGFRRMSEVERLAWGVALSFAVMPILAVTFGHHVGLGGVCWLGSVCGIGLVGLAGWQWWGRRTQASESRAGAPRLVASAIVMVWVAFVLAELVDVGVGSRLFLSVTVYDHALRTAFVDAVMRTGVPPVNPLYWPGGHGAPMRYYYFWYVLTAAAARLGAATARQAMIGSVVWGGFGLSATVELYCRHFVGGEKNRLSSPHRRWPRFGVAMGLLMVTGLDVVPAVVKALAGMPADADMEWWSQAQVASWMDSLLWVPHHVAGLACCLTGFLLVWMAKGAGGKQRAISAAIAGAGFASAFGLSTWVAVAFAIVMVAWAAWVLGWERHDKTWLGGRVPVLLAAGVVTVVLLVPYLAELRGEASGVETVEASGAGIAKDGATSAGGATHLLRFGVRHIIDPNALLGVPGFAELKRVHPQLEDAVAGLVLLAPGYVAELGFYGLVLVLAVRVAGRRGLGEAERTALVLAVAGLTVATFLGSSVVANNDFGMRSILIPQFFLLLLAVRWFESGLAECELTKGGWMRGAMRATLWIGVAGTVYQAVLLRVYLPVEESLRQTETVGLAERAMAWRNGFAEMDRRIPKPAVIQFNTNQPNDFFGYAQILTAGRQMGSGLPVCAAAFGGDPAACAEVAKGVTRLFAAQNVGIGQAVTISADAARTECASLGVNDLVATRWDAVWGDPAGWVWSLPPVVDTGDVRVLDCGRSNAAASR